MRAQNHDMEILTFDEFKERANRKPVLDGAWIYQLTQAIMDNDIKVPYPMFDLYNREERLFLSFDDALTYIRENKRENTYCNWISQILVGERQQEHGAVWLLDEGGNIIDYTTTYSFGEGEEAHFYGRPIERQRFKRGDIVEVVSGDKVRLAVLNSDVPDIEHCWGIYNRCIDRSIGDGHIPYILDYSDDSEVVIDGPSYCFHDHVSPLVLLEPRFPIPEDIREEMKTWVERAQKENETRYEYQNTYRGERNRCYGDKVGDFYGLNLYLHFPEGDSMPLLLIDDYYGFKVSLHVDRPDYADYKDYTGRLTDPQLKSLQDYLEDTEVGKTKWWYILRDWNEDEDHKAIPLDTPLPDYTTLTNRE